MYIYIYISFLCLKAAARQPGGGRVELEGQHRTAVALKPDNVISW